MEERNKLIFPFFSNSKGNVYRIIWFTKKMLSSYEILFQSTLMRKKVLVFGKVGVINMIIFSNNKRKDFLLEVIWLSEAA